MNTRLNKVIIALGLLLPASASTCFAQPTLSPPTIVAGAGTSSGGSYRLSGTIGQAETGEVSGGRYSIRCGYFSHGRSTVWCAADVDDGTGSGAPDGAVAIEDLIYYITQFEAGSLQADIDGGASDGLPDGGVGIEDLLYFLRRFEVGC